MNLVLDIQEANGQYNSILPAANKSLHIICPLCQSGAVNGIFIEPLCFNDVEGAIALKKNELPSLGTNHFHSPKQQSRKHPRDEDVEIQAESPYLLLSNSNSSISCSGLSRGQQRTGRWTNEESALVEFLVTTFDQGLLPLPHGIKLNEFLGDMLLCKSSRLTKKMKNAKLSTRSFVLGKPCAQFSRRDREKLSILQESFLSSLSSESTRLVLKLNLAKQWRTHFYNICLQIGYPHIQENAWNSSLQELEERATSAEEVVRSIRRRKMGLKPQHYDGGTFKNPNQVFDFVKADQPGNDPKTNNLATTTASVVSNDQKSLSFSHVSIVSNQEKSRTISSTSEEDVSNINYDEDRDNNFNSDGQYGRPRTLSTDISISSIKSGRNRSFSEDFDALLDVLTKETTEADDSCRGKTTTVDKKPKSPSNFCGPLLDSIVSYIESNNLPFQYVDLWVPSFSSGENEGQSKSIDVDQLSLYNAGYKSRQDINNEMARMLQEFGVYSSYFSFEPAKGLPGRVYASGVASWECGLQERDPNDFCRVEGAALYGVKTALAIPLNTEMVGRIVVLLYSCENVPEDTSLARDIAAELNKYSLEPKWKLVHSNAQSNVQSSTNLSRQKMMTAEEHDTKSFSNFSNRFTSVAHDVIVESTNYLKGSDSDISSNSLPNITETVKSSQRPIMPAVQRDVNGLSRLSPQNEMHTTHYLHRATNAVLGSEVESGEDSELASFLNHNMPVVSNSTSTGYVTSSSDARTLRPYFLSFRLLLLRPFNERTSRENEIIRILKSSYRAYARDNRRNTKELANLLVKDWVCLKSTFSFQEVAIPHKELYKSESHLLPMTSMSPMCVESAVVQSFKSIPSAPQELERQFSSDYHGATTLPSIHPIEPRSQQFVSDFSENRSDQLSRVSESPSSSSSKLMVDHKRYLPQKSSMDSVEYTSSNIRS
jgi:hypothetical protein